MVLCRIADDLLHLLGGIGVDHHIRQAVDLLVPQTQKIVAGAAIGHRKSFVIPGGDKFFPDDLFQRLQVLRGDARVVIRERDLIKADIIGVVPEVLIGHMEGFLHHLVEGFLGVLEKLGIAPAEDGTIAARRGGSQQPLGLEAFVRFIAHGHSPFRFSQQAGGDDDIHPQAQHIGQHRFSPLHRTGHTGAVNFPHDIENFILGYFGRGAYTDDRDLRKNGAHRGAEGAGGAGHLGRGELFPPFTGIAGDGKTAVPLFDAQGAAPGTDDAGQLSHAPSPQFPV